MQRLTWIAAAASITLAVAGVHAQTSVRDGVLADAAGRTLYVFDKDTANQSNCSGGCLVAWPAFVAKAGANPQGDLTILEAKGVRQWAFKGKPLYYFAGDVQPGERNGDGSGGVWHVVSVKAVIAKTSGY